MENTPRKVLENHGKHTTKGPGKSRKTHHERSWKIMENTPQKSWKKHVRCSVRTVYMSLISDGVEWFKEPVGPRWSLALYWMPFYLLTLFTGRWDVLRERSTGADTPVVSNLLLFRLPFATVSEAGANLFFPSIANGYLWPPRSVVKLIWHFMKL